MIFHDLVRSTHNDFYLIRSMAKSSANVINQALKREKKFLQSIYSIYKISDEGVQVYTQCVFGDFGDSGIDCIYPARISEEDFDFIVKAAG